MSNKQALEELKLLEKMFEPEIGYGLEQIAIIRDALTEEAVDIDEIFEETWKGVKSDGGFPDIMTKVLCRSYVLSAIIHLAEKGMIHPVEQYKAELLEKLSGMERDIPPADGTGSQGLCNRDIMLQHTIHNSAIGAVKELITIP